MSLLLPSLLVEGTKGLSESFLSFMLQDLMAPPVLEEESFDSTVLSQEDKASETVDLTRELGLFGDGSLR